MKTKLITTADKSGRNGPETKKKGIIINRNIDNLSRLRLDI